MKTNSILIIALAIVAVQFFNSAAHAQATTGTTILRVKLADVLSLTVNDAEVLLDFDNADKYANGVSVVKPNHLTVTSTKPYTINVKAATATLAGTGSNTNTIAVNKVNVDFPDPSGQGLGGTSAGTIALSTTDTPLITAASPAGGKNINVEYAIPAANTGAVLGLAADTYSTTLTYTVTQ